MRHRVFSSLRAGFHALPLSVSSFARASLARHAKTSAWCHAGAHDPLHTCSVSADADMPERLKPKRPAPPSEVPSSGLRRLWCTLTASLGGKGDADTPSVRRSRTPSGAHDTGAEHADRKAAPRAPRELTELFLVHPPARRMFPNLRRLSTMWAQPGSAPLLDAAPQLLRAAAAELERLAPAAGQAPGLQGLRVDLLAALARREAAPRASRHEDGMRSRFGEERLEVGETSMDDFVQEQQAWGKTKPGRLSAG